MEMIRRKDFRVLQFLPQAQSAVWHPVLTGGHETKLSEERHSIASSLPLFWAQSLLIQIPN